MVAGRSPGAADERTGEFKGYYTYENVSSVSVNWDNAADGGDSLLSSALLLAGHHMFTSTTAGIDTAYIAYATIFHLPKGWPRAYIP